MGEGKKKEENNRAMSREEAIARFGEDGFSPIMSGGVLVFQAIKEIRKDATPQGPAIFSIDDGYES